MRIACGDATIVAPAQLSPRDHAAPSSFSCLQRVPLRTSRLVNYE